MLSLGSYTLAWPNLAAQKRSLASVYVFEGDLYQRCTSITLLVKHGHEVDLLLRKLTTIRFEFVFSRDISLALPPLCSLMWLGRGRWPFDLFLICEEVKHIICDEICECNFLRQLISNNDF
jgi:hypothetical protein